jgi:hypothetical protein
MNTSLRYSIIALIILLLVWWCLKSREHFKCNNIEKNHDYQYTEKSDRSCKDNCECKGIRICNDMKCVIP